MSDRIAKPSDAKFAMGNGIICSKSDGRILLKTAAK